MAPRSGGKGRSWGIYRIPTETRPERVHAKSGEGSDRTQRG